jgi:signal transduction histidine kinase
MTGRWSRLSLRSRLMGVGLLGVAAALLLSGILLSASMSAALIDSVDDGTRASARDVAALVDAGRIPDPIPVTGSQVVQVLDEDNGVVAVSATADRLTPLVTQAERERLMSGDAITVPGSRTAQSGELRVVVAEARTGDAPLLVVVAAPTADLETTARLLRTLLLVFYPVVLLALGLVAWRVIGSALQPVEELRHGAERIGEGTVNERLPVPDARDEIAALATTLNGMLDRLASAHATQRAFVADAAHELRSPLATMRTQLEVAQRLGDGGRLPGDLLPEVARLSALIEDLLLLARTGDTSPAPREPIDLTRLVQEVAQRYSSARIPVQLTAQSSELAFALGSWDELLRAATNLVDNAVRHAATKVELRVVAEPTRVELSVRDDGHGIPETERERVFDRFARLDEARDRDSGGSGLGLAITRELVRRAGGDIRLEDAGPGLRAVITFPRA